MGIWLARKHNEIRTNLPTNRSQLHSHVSHRYRHTLVPNTVRYVHVYVWTTEQLSMYVCLCPNYTLFFFRYLHYYFNEVQNSTFIWTITWRIHTQTVIIYQAQLPQLSISALFALLSLSPSHSLSLSLCVCVCYINAPNVQMEKCATGVNKCKRAEIEKHFIFQSIEKRFWLHEVAV